VSDELIHSEDDPTDPVNVILAFVEHLISTGGSRRKLPLDRDRLLVTLILALLTDPHHHVGKVITRDLFKTWIERGGKVPIQGYLSRSLRETDEFEFAVQYLYDYGMKLSDIAMALGCTEQTIRNVLKYFTPKT
jgi:hypothetical protein